MRKPTLAIIIPLAAIVFVASCSKQSEPAPAQAKKETPRATVIAVKNAPDKKAAKTPAKPAVLAGNNTLTVTRDGQYANLSWHTDVPAADIRKITILRSSTGLTKQIPVAELNPDATSHRDCTPGAGAQWYWVQLSIQGGGDRVIGATRVEPDRSGSAQYIRPEDAYHISITRTDDMATLQWDFPDDEYKSIKVVRNTRVMAQPFGKNSIRVVTSPEGKLQYDNPLSNPNADYWYWFQITTKQGVIITKGPIKAGYTRPKRQ